MKGLRILDKDRHPIEGETAKAWKNVLGETWECIVLAARSQEHKGLAFPKLRGAKRTRDKREITHG